MTDNSYYLKALLESDTDIIKDIYKSNFFKVKSFVINNKGQAVDAEDIFQKALLQLTLRYKTEKFVIESSFEAYLFTVCKNLWRRELNKSKIKVTKYKEIEQADEYDDIAMATIEQKQWDLFHECLQLIPKTCKSVLDLYFAKASYKEMVKTLNYKTETVARQRVFRCKNKLKELIRRDKRFNALNKS